MGYGPVGGLLCGSGALGILLPKMGRKALSKYFLEDPEFNLGPEANMFNRFLREKIAYCGILPKYTKNLLPESILPANIDG